MGVGRATPKHVSGVARLPLNNMGVAQPPLNPIGVAPTPTPWADQSLQTRFAFLFFFHIF